MGCGQLARETGGVLLGAWSARATEAGAAQYRHYVETDDVTTAKVEPEARATLADSDPAVVHRTVLVSG